MIVYGYRKDIRSPLPTDGRFKMIDVNTMIMANITEILKRQSREQINFLI